MDVSTWRSRNFFTLTIIAAAVFCTFGAASKILAQEPPPLPYVGNTLNFWRFDDTNWLSGRGDAPRYFYGLQSTAGVRGNALKVAGTGPAILQYKEVEPTGRTNIQCDVGTIRLWFGPNNWASSNLGGFGPGAYGRLIDMGAWTQNASYGWWSLYLSPDGNRLYFSGQTNGSSADFLSANIQFASNEWHHVALTYTSSNSVLYIDGVYATNGSAPLYWPGAAVRATNGFTVGSDINGQNLAQGVFDELRIYDYPFRAEEIFSYFDADLEQGGFESSSTLIPLEPTGCVATGAVYITNFVCNFHTNLLWNAVFDIAGGTNGILYDIFATTNLATSGGTNSQWTWLGRGYSCYTYQVVDMPPGQTFFMLGDSTYDPDGDGLSSAFENLVSKSKPNNSNSDGDDMGDYFEAVLGRDPNQYGWSPDANGVVNLETFVPRR